MTDTIRPVAQGAGHSALRVTAYVVLTVAVLAQLGAITQYWWQPPPCDRQLEFQHYVDCINGRYHREIAGAGLLAVITWCIAGIAWLLGRLAPPSVSALLPATLWGMAALLANDFWEVAVSNVPAGPHGPEYTPDYWTLTASGLAFWCTPATGAWMAGLAVRISRNGLPRNRVPPTAG